MKLGFPMCGEKSRKLNVTADVSAVTFVPPHGNCKSGVVYLLSPGGEWR